jgi:radical SAM protein with 4Fe4S-binding SPASM domain
MHNNHQSLFPSVIAWETTRRCNLNCKHCRGSARDQDYSSEFTTEECFKVIDNIAEGKKSLPTNPSAAPHGMPPSPILILTGGEPMMRPDIFDIARYATDKGIYVVMAPCGHLITPETAKQMKDAGIQAISISIDAATEEKHDEFRGTAGAYKKTIAGLQHAIAVGIPFQVNTTVTKLNIGDLPAIYKLACELGAKTFDAFFLVPTGRGSELKDLEISAEEHENALKWIHETSLNSPIRVKTTCAPHYARIQKQSSEKGGHPSGGCMGGRGFVFISHRGILQPCGFFDMPSGDLRANDYDFMKVYRESKIFNDLRRVDDYQGKCGTCEYRRVCGGCRARALAHTGNYMDEEPSCDYEPRKR